MTQRTKDHVNNVFEPLLDDPMNKNPARIADEAVASHLQAAGSAVYAIGHVLTRGENGPLVPATLARTVLENSAVVRFLCTPEDPINRTGRAIDVLHSGLRGAGAVSLEHPLNPHLQSVGKLKERMGTLGLNRVDKLPQNYNQLVDSYLNEIEAGPVYKRLNQFAHHNMVSHTVVMASADQGTIHNYVDIYDFATRAGIALFYAVEAAQPFKAAAPPSLKCAMYNMVQQYGNFYTYCVRMAESSRPT